MGVPQVYFDPKNSVGLVFSHGYLSVPAALEDMAKYLFERGINVYLPRLKGHGTDAKALKEISYKAWENDFERAFTAMSQVCDKVIIGGFSIGGLLALLHAAKYEVDGVVIVNTALKLNNLKVDYVVATLNAFNEMIEHLHAHGIKEWIENKSELSDLNYLSHPLTSVGELEKLMDKTRKNLSKVDAPLLIIQGDKDPVVNAKKSAEMLYEGVSTSKKELMLIPRTNHNILTGRDEDTVELFKDIYDFIMITLSREK